jgi:hypothetical protein
MVNPIGGNRLFNNNTAWFEINNSINPNADKFIKLRIDSCSIRRATAQSPIPKKIEPTNLIPPKKIV